MAYKLGRKSPKNAPAIKFADIFKAVPDHPATEDYLSFGGWDMLGNDRYGDCVAVTWANVRRLMTRQAGQENYPPMDQVIEFYKTQNPGFPNQDGGMDIQTALEDLVHSGGPDGVKALAFAKVDQTNLDEVKAAVAIFGFLWTGIVVQQAQMQQFDANQPWDYVPNSPDEGGHSIISGGYDSDNVGGDVKFVTWAQETSFTDAYWKNKTEEAWVVIWPEHLKAQPFLEGIDQQKLADAYQQITGRPFPGNTPPAPQPAPNPVDVNQALVQAGTAWLGAKFHSHHVVQALRDALTAWIAAQQS